MSEKPPNLAFGRVRIRPLRGPSGDRWYWRAEVHQNGSSRTVWVGWATQEEVVAAVRGCCPDASDEAERERLNENKARNTFVTTSVYFAKGVDGLIKVGFSKKPAARVSDLRTAAPGLRLIRAVPGSPHLERAIHQTFAHLRVQREWFKSSPALLAYIEELPGP